jgi:DNA-binding XRE family transcriptional regulator
MVAVDLKAALALADKRARIAALAGWVQGLYPSSGTPVLVGGAAVELHAGPALTTGDLDFVGAVPESVARVLSAGGFQHHGREWVNDEGCAFLEFRPGGLAAGEGTSALRVSGHSLLCLGREELLINRLASWATWASPVDGMNAYLLFTRPKATPDIARLEALARARGAEKALVSLCALVSRKPKAQDVERWAVEGAAPRRVPARPGLPPPPRRRRPRAFLKWAALRRWGALPSWEEFTAGYLLREARERAGLTQSDLASRLGVSQQAVAQAERWRANPTAHLLRAWAEACGQDLLLEFGGGQDAKRD